MALVLWSDDDEDLLLEHVQLALAAPRHQGALQLALLCLVRPFFDSFLCDMIELDRRHELRFM
jgi:hypothetical protein